MEMFLAKRLGLPANPFEDASKAKFATVHRAVYELVSFFCPYFDVETVAPQKDVGGSESDTFTAVEEPVIVTQRLHQRGRFFFERFVAAGLRTENRGLNCVLVANPV